MNLLKKSQAILRDKGSSRITLEKGKPLQEGLVASSGSTGALLCLMVCEEGTTYAVLTYILREMDTRELFERTSGLLSFLILDEHGSQTEFEFA